jgi:hypothetical protein
MTHYCAIAIVFVFKLIGGDKNGRKLQWRWADTGLCCDCAEGGSAKAARLA